MGRVGEEEEEENENENENENGEGGGGRGGRVLRSVGYFILVNYTSLPVMGGSAGQITEREFIRAIL